MGALQRRATGQVHIMIAMPQLVSQRAYTSKGRFVVGKHTRFVAAHRGAIGSIALARSWLGIDPVLAKSTGRKPGETFGVCAKLLYNKGRGIVKVPDFLLRTQWRVEIIPGETGQSQCTRFGMQIAPKVGKRCSGRRKHGIQRPTVDTVREERRVQGRLPMPSLCQNIDLILNAVECRSQGKCGLLPALQFRLISPTTYLTIRVKRHVTYDTHGEFTRLAIYF